MKTLYSKPHFSYLLVILLLATAYSSRFALGKAEQVPPWTKARWQELTKCNHPHYPRPKPTPPQNRDIYLKSTFIGQSISLTFSELVLSTTTAIATAIAIFLTFKL